MTPTGEPWSVPTGERPDFDAVVEHPVQIWDDLWRRRARIMRFRCYCINCQIPTWSFDDGENDPRGILGEHTYWPIGLDDHGTEYEVGTCALCANDYARYERCLMLAWAELHRRQSGRFLPNCRIKIRLVSGTQH